MLTDTETDADRQIIEDREEEMNRSMMDQPVMEIWIRNR